MRVLVTGGLGFVAVHVVRQLALGGHTVVVLDRDEPASVHGDFLAGTGGRVSFLRADLTGDAWRDRLGPVDAVVHAAAVTPLDATVERNSATTAVTVNVLATAKLLDFAREQRLHRFVYVSSGSVYGTPDRARIDEDCPVAPRTVYGITKAAADLLTQRYADLGAGSVVVARLAQPYGPMERVTDARGALSPIHDWALAALRGGPLPVEPGSLDRGRDYVYVADVAAALVGLTAAAHLGHRVYNVSSGARVRLGDILDRITAQTGVGEQVDGHVNLSAQDERAVLDAERLTEEIGWRAETDLDQGIAATLTWLRATLPQGVHS